MSVLTAIVDRIASYTALAATMTLPGLLLAVAVVLFQVHLPPGDAAKPSPLSVLLEWSSRDGPLAARVETLKAEHLDMDAALRDAQADIVGAARTKGRTEEALANARTRAKSIQDNASPPDRGELQTAAEEAADEFQAARVTFANAEAHVRNQQIVWESLSTEVAAVRTQRSQNIQSLADTLIGNVVALGLLSVVIGTLLRPLNRLLLGPIAWLSAYRFARNWLARHCPLPFPAPGAGPPPSPSTGDAGPSSAPSTPGTGPSPPPSMYVLRKISENVISMDDYDFLASRYYVVTEIAVGLVIPLLIVGLALSRWWPFLAWVAWAPAVALLVIGYVSYLRFETYVRVFIDGRLKESSMTADHIE